MLNSNRPVYAKVLLSGIFVLVITFVMGMIRKAYAEETPKIPAAAQVLLAGWEDNLRKIQTLKANLTLHVMDRRWAEYEDIHGKQYNDQIAKITLWKDGSLLREDNVYNRTFSANKVRYNLPFGEHIHPSGEIDLDDLKRKHGTKKTTRRFLSRDGKAYKYSHEAKLLDIREPPDLLERTSTTQCWMLHGALFYRTSLSEMFSRWRLQSQSTMIVTDLENGKYKIHMGQDKANPKSRGITVFIDTEKGYTIERIVHTTIRDGKKQIEFDGNFTYTLVGGAWVLAEAETIEYDKSGEELRRKTLKVNRDSLKVNEPIESRVFTVDDLRIAKGTYVTDMFKKEKYLYNDIPLDLKIALALAQKDQYELPEGLDSIPTPVNLSQKEAHQEAENLSKTRQYVTGKTAIPPVEEPRDVSDGSSATTTQSGFPTFWILPIAIISIVIGIGVFAYRRRKEGAK